MIVQNNHTKRLLFRALGLLISVIPVCVSIFSYFPLWISRRDSSLISGISLLLLCVALVPLYKYIKKALKSPSAPMMWFLSFVIFLLLSRIADEVTVISFVGFVTNLIGSVFFKIANKYNGEVKK